MPRSRLPVAGHLTIRWSTTGNRPGRAPEPQGAPWLTPSPSRGPSVAPTEPCPSRPASWPTWPTAPSSPASATPSCWPPPPRPGRSGKGTDFFPLTVDIEERAYAAGKIPGSFFRREGKSSDQAILTCRLIDRPLRPSFPKGFRNEVHVVGTIFGADQVNPHDVLAINAASAALMLSGIPFDGPIGAVRIAYSTEGTWIPHPTYQEGDESTFELVVAGRALERRRRRRGRDHDGRGRRHREVLGVLRGRRPEGHRRGPRRRPRGRQDLDPRVDQPPA